MIFHLLLPNEWSAAKAKGSYCPSSLGSEGFIHFSTQTQVLRSAHNYFKGTNQVTLLAVEEASVQGILTWENTVGGTELFPHVYGSLQVAQVVATYDLARDEEGRFKLPANLEGPS